MDLNFFIKKYKIKQIEFSKSVNDNERKYIDEKLLLEKYENRKLPTIFFSINDKFDRDKIKKHRGFALILFEYKQLYINNNKCNKNNNFLNENINNPNYYFLFKNDDNQLSVNRIIDDTNTKIIYIFNKDDNIIDKLIKIVPSIVKLELYIYFIDYDDINISKIVNFTNIFIKKISNIYEINFNEFDIHLSFNKNSYNHFLPILDNINKLYYFKNFNLDKRVLLSMLNYKKNSFDTLLNKPVRKKFNFIVFDQPIINKLNGCINNEIEVMKNLASIHDIYYNDVFINNLINDDSLNIEKLNEQILDRKSRIKIDELYKENIMIFKPTENYDCTFVRCSKEEHKLIFKLIPGKKVFSHNYEKDIWENEIIGFQTDVAAHLAKNKLLKYIPDDGTLNYFNRNMVEPKEVYVRRSFIPKFIKNEKFTMIKELGLVNFIKVCVIGDINKFTNFLFLEKIVEKYNTNHEKKIKLIILTQKDIGTNENILCLNLDKNKYLDFLSNCDLAISTWNNPVITYSNSNKVLDCIAVNIPIIMPHSFFCYDVLGFDYPYFYNISYQKTEIEYLIQKVLLEKNFNYNIDILNYNKKILDNYASFFIINSMKLSTIIEKFNIEQICYSQKIPEYLNNSIKNVSNGNDKNLNTIFFGCDNQIDRLNILNNKSEIKIVIFFDDQINRTKTKCKKNKTFLQNNNTIKSFIFKSLEHIILYDETTNLLTTFNNITKYILYGNGLDNNKESYVDNILIPYIEYNIKQNRNTLKKFACENVDKVCNEISDKINQTDKSILENYNGLFKENIIKKINSYFQNKVTDKKRIINNFQYGHINSMIRIVEDAIANNKEEIIIFEQDIFIHKDCLKFLEDFNNIKKNVPLIYFGVSKNDTKIDNKNYKATNATGTFAFYINKQIYSDFLELLRLYILPSDICLTILQDYYSCYVYPDIIISDLDNSTITHRENIESIYTRYGWNLNNYFTPIINYETLVVMPTYNRGENIEKQIISMLNQTAKNIFMIIDDGSRNKEQFYLLKSKYHNYNNIIFEENEENLHIAKTLNRGIEFFLKNTTLKYFTWISDDNIYYENFLEKLKEGNEYFNYSCFRFRNEILNKEHVVKKVYKEVNDLIYHFEGLGSFMWSRNAIEKIGFYNTEFPGGEDYEYLLRTFIQNDKCKFINITLMTYIRNSDSLYEKIKDNILEIKSNIINSIKPNN